MTFLPLIRTTVPPLVCTYWSLSAPRCPWTTKIKYIMTELSRHCFVYPTCLLFVLELHRALSFSYPAYGASDKADEKLNCYRVSTQWASEIFADHKHGMPCMMCLQRSAHEQEIWLFASCCSLVQAKKQSPAFQTYAIRPPVSLTTLKQHDSQERQIGRIFVMPPTINVETSNGSDMLLRRLKSFCKSSQKAVFDGHAADWLFLCILAETSSEAHFRIMLLLPSTFLALECLCSECAVKIDIMHHLSTFHNIQLMLLTLRILDPG
jgi:hypothetical protein